ncbi:MAG: DNA polymerase III subunit alpha [Deltaproteobacteria bacterium]|nr:DNA polymerase III subunit alpha [Deltaproteobacteria bacterium]
MIKEFADFPGAVENTVRIAERIDLKLPLGKFHFPRFSDEDDAVLEERMTGMAWAGLEKRLADEEARVPGFRAKNETTYRERLTYELSVIVKMGFASYFLIVSDFIGYARSKSIPVGPGRGSAAGSLAAYSLGITDLDPLKYDLIFERFLNVERMGMPDVDVDFCKDGREEVIHYVMQRYGGEAKDRVAQIITFGSMKAKAVVRDVGRALNMPFADVDKIAKLVPAQLNITLDKAIEAEPKLKELVDTDPQVKNLMTIAKTLEGLSRHASTHAAGVVISDRSIVEYLPLYKGSNDEIVTQYDMKCVERVGLVKFDFLGLITLTVMDYAVKMIRANHDPNFKLEDIDLTDQPTYELLCRGDTTGVFQLESSGMKDLLTRLRPECFDDVIALVALYRPGPLESGMVDDFINRKHGRTVTEYLLPQLEEALKETYGVIVYQEQVMRIAALLADYSMGEADFLRKAMGKKIPEVMEKQRSRFMEGAERKKLDLEKAAQIFDLMAKFGGYGFNKSHSAAYALIAFQTAYLKTHYTVEFMAALLTSEMSNTDKIVNYIGNCRDMGIEVLPPDINESDRNFAAVGGRVRFGLAGIKMVGQAAIEAIFEAREKDGGFTSLFDFCDRVDLRRVNKKVLEYLIKAGAFDFSGANRAQLFDGLDEAMDRGQKAQKSKKSGQFSLFDAKKSKNGLKTGKLPEVPEWRDSIKLRFEKEAIGFYISGHPLNKFEPDLKEFADVNTENVAGQNDDNLVSLGGMVATVKRITTKKGDPMAFVNLEDLYGTMELVVFSDIFAASQELLVPDSLIFVTGKVKHDDRGVKLIVTEIIDLAEARYKKAKTVVYRIKTTALTPDRLKELKALFAKYQGSSRTFLNLVIPNESETSLSLPQDYRLAVTPDMVRDVSQFSADGQVILMR